MIVVDPENIDLVVSSDAILIKEINNYCINIGINPVAIKLNGHNDHIHIGYNN
jgi:hypothetical protein